MKRILIVEDALKDYNGHWFEQITCICNASKKFNTTIDVACNKKVVREISNKISTFPTFRYSYFLDTSVQVGIKSKLTTYIKFYANSLFSLWRLLKLEEKYDIVFLPTATIHHILYLLIINLIHPNKPHKIVPLFLNPPGLWNEQEKKIHFPKSASYFKYLIKLFNKSKRTVLAVQTNNAKTTLEEYTKCYFKVFPQPIDFITTKNDNNNSKSQLTFGSFGSERYEKGTDILVKAVEQLTKNKHDISFKIQWIHGFRNTSNTFINLPHSFYNNSSIEIFASHLSRDDYNLEMNKTDCIILPYRNSSYFFRDSRVVLEAAIREIPIIYTKGGWLEEFAQNYKAGIGFEDENFGDLVKAIKTMSSNYSYYKKLAIENKSKIESQFSPENFISTLIAL